MSTAISAARRRGLRRIAVPDANAVEAAAFFAGHLDIDPTPSRLQEDQVRDHQRFDPRFHGRRPWDPRE
jgi:hypothetical protein